MANAPLLPLADVNARDRRRQMLADVRDGLFSVPRVLSPKYFYDARGSQLFEQITTLPEYYLTRAEREILSEHAGEIIDLVAPRTLVELGAGSASKTRLLLDPLVRRGGSPTYVPVDVSNEFLEDTARQLGAEYRDLRVTPMIADISESFDLPAEIPGPVLFAFLGSTIGNFDGNEAVALLQRVHASMRPNDRFLLGTDLRKSTAILNAAYNDSAGVTAEFNRNMLRVLNRELGADFVPERYAHRAFYNSADHRIEMHLDSIGDQVVHVPALPAVILRAGESIRTELSYKYDRPAVDALLGPAGLRVCQWFTDAEDRFALSLIEPVA